MIEASRLLEGPALEPVTRDEAKDFLRVTFTDDDSLVGALIKAAREQAEAVTGRALMPQTWELYLKSFPNGKPLEFPLAPFKEISSVKYWDTSGTQITAPSSLYETNFQGELSSLSLAYNQSWPSLESGRMLPVTIEYEAGYDDAAAVPEGIKVAILMLVSHWYNNREPVIVGTNAMEMPLSVERLLWPFRLMRF